MEPQTPIAETRPENNLKNPSITPENVPPASPMPESQLPKQPNNSLLVALSVLLAIMIGETAFLANVAQKIVVDQVTLGDESGFEEKHRVIFKEPRTVDYRADVHDIGKYLMLLMTDAALREKMGKAARERVVKNFDYRVVAKRFVQIMNDKLGIK